jgi:hypothetical protein
MDYKDALVNAPIWVRKAYEEFEKLPEKQKQNTPFLYFVLGKGKGTPPFKMSKKESNYKAKTTNPDFVCGNCVYYYWHVTKKRGICSQIRGEVEYNGICRLWARDYPTK